MDQPLSGVRVVEICCSAAAGFCGRQFRAWGAEVLRMEGPAVPDGSPASSDFLRQGKLTLADQDLHSLLRELKKADVLILDVAACAALGVEADAFRDNRRDLVVIHFSAFGLSGPRAGRDAEVWELQALNGLAALNGRLGGGPRLAPARILDHGIGVNGFIGGLAALIRKARNGHGDRVEISGLETLSGLLPYLRDQQAGLPASRQGGTPEGGRLIRCADGWIAGTPGVPVHLEVYRDVLGITACEAPDHLLVEGEGFAADRVARALETKAMERPRETLFMDLQSRNVVCGMVRTPDEVLACSQLRALDGNAGPEGPEVKSGAPRRCARLVDGGLGRIGGPGLAPTQAPLSGFRVLDLTQAWIGPLAGMILADLGAEVIKVEGPLRPDIWRLLGQAPFAEGETGSPLDRSCYFNAVNRGKRGLSLDLTSAEGASVLHRLVGETDILLENFTPSVMSRFGLDFQTLMFTNPGLVMTSFSGFGAAGPWSGFKANGVSIEALAGWTSQCRDEDGAPLLMATYPADPLGGLQMAAVTLVGLLRRLRSGRGAHLEGSMLEAATEYIGDVLLSTAQGSRPVADVAKVEAAEDGGWRVVGEGRSVPVRTTLEALEDDQLQSRGWFIPLVTPGQGRRLHPGAFWRFQEAGLHPPEPPPRLGEHTDAVLLDAGLSAEEIRDLRSHGVISAPAID